MTKREIAENYFVEGYNCAQAVVLAFADEICSSDEEKERLLKISSSFGGGFGRLREICGAVSGMGIVAGALYGIGSGTATEQKSEHYALIQKLAGKFSEINGSIICRELLGAKKAAANPTPDARTPEYYKTRPCAKLVGDAAGILESLLNEKA